MSGRSVDITTLFLGRLRPPKQLTSMEGETKGCSQTGYQTQDPLLTSQVPYRLRYAAQRFKG